jgi:hypothetical protein
MENAGDAMSECERRVQSSSLWQTCERHRTAQRGAAGWPVMASVGVSDTVSRLFAHAYHAERRFSATGGLRQLRGQSVGTELASPRPLTAFRARNSSAYASTTLHGPRRASKAQGRFEVLSTRHPGHGGRR